MAASVERALAKAAAALLPGLLPTPPPPMSITAIIIPPAASNPKPGRADAVERWDAHKNQNKNRPRSPASSSSGSTSPGRADSCERWHMNKKIKNPISSSSSSTASSSSMSSRGSNGMVSGDIRYKRPPPSRASSSADRWDTHKKKPHDALPDAESQITGDKTTAMEETAAPGKHLVFSGPSFVVASPEPSTLPMPAFFFPRRAGTGMTVPLPASVQAH